MDKKIEESIKKSLERELGVPYEEFDELDFDEQQKLISKHRNKNRGKNSSEATVMIGTGENSTFTKVKKGERVMVGTGEHSCFVRAGITPEEEKEEVEYELDKICYGKPVALVKKFERKLKNNKNPRK